jgi:hypothetical protein
MSEAHLPAAVAELLNGHDLQTKVGPTFLLVACEPEGWPRMALLSVGEVLAVSPSEVRLALYRQSGTTRALAHSGKALLVVVVDGVTYKIRLAATELSDAEVGEGGDAVFLADVRSVDEDQVAYAVVEHGVEFTLIDETAVVERWLSSVDRLRGVRT